MKRILIIEDDVDVREELKVLLCRNGYEAEYITDFKDACKQILAANADMVLLDINLPGVDGESLLKELSKNEMGILGYFIKNQGRIISRDELMSYLWDSEEFVDDNTLTVNINRVRKKLEECGLLDVIQTKRGQGYIIG